MAKKRVVQTKTTGKQWGVQNGYTVVRRRKDETTYIEYRHPYYADVPVIDNGETVGHERKRLFAASSVSPTEAKELAHKRARKYERESEDYWKEIQIKRGSRQPDPLPKQAKAKVRKTIVECAEEWMETRKRYVDGVVTGAQFGYRKKQNGYISTLESSPLSGHHMDVLTLSDIVTWFTATYMTSHMETTAARFKAWLIGVGEWGRRNKYWDDNLFDGLPTLSASAKNKDERVYTLDEIDRMWEAAITPQERALLVLLRCGLRQGECTGLAEDKVLDGQTIIVAYTLGYEDNIWRSRTPLGKIPKTVQYLHRAKGQSAGKVHVPKPWMAIIGESVEVAGADLIRAYDDATAKDNLNPGEPRHRCFVCCNRYGLAWSDTCVSEALRKLMKRAGVSLGNTHQTFHAWRHALCSDLLALGCGDMELALIMRHRDYNMSKSVYASARLEHLSAYKKYAKGVDSPKEYVDALCKFDEDRRAQKRKRKLTPPSIHEQTVEGGKGDLN